MTAFDSLVFNMLKSPKDMLIETNILTQCTPEQCQIHHRLSHHPLYASPVIICMEGFAAMVNRSFVNTEYEKKIDITNQYLCTGLDLYCTYEPNLFVSMALLHSRIRRVIYLEARADGALGSLYKIHLLPNTNHRFQVFRYDYTQI